MLQTVTRCIFSNQVAHTELANFTTEASLLQGAVKQPVLPSLFFDGPGGIGKAFKIVAMGTGGFVGGGISMTFKVYLNTTAGLTNFGGSLIATSTTLSSLAAGAVADGNFWRMELDYTTTISGQGTNGTELIGGGLIWGPSLFVSPSCFGMAQAAAPTATWTEKTIDSLLPQYINFSCTVAASGDPATRVKCYIFQVFELN